MSLAGAGGAVLSLATGGLLGLGERLSWRNRVPVSADQLRRYDGFFLDGLDDGFSLLDGGFSKFTDGLRGHFSSRARNGQLTLDFSLSEKLINAGLRLLEFCLHTLTPRGVTERRPAFAFVEGQVLVADSDGFLAKAQQRFVDSRDTFTGFVGAKKDSANLIRHGDSYSLCNSRDCTPGTTSIARMTKRRWV